MSDEFKTQLFEKLATDPTDHILALAFLAFIIVATVVVVMYKLSIRLMIAYIALKTGVELSKAAGFGRLKDTFTKALNK